MQRGLSAIAELLAVYTASGYQSYCDFSIWPNGLEARPCTCCAGSGIIYTEFGLGQLIRTWIIAFFDADTSDTLWHAVTFTFDPLTLKVCGTSGVTWSKSVLNLSEIEQSPAELFIILQMFAHVISGYELDLLTLNFYSNSGVMRLNSVQNLSEIE